MNLIFFLVGSVSFLLEEHRKIDTVLKDEVTVHCDQDGMETRVDEHLLRWGHGHHPPRLWSAHTQSSTYLLVVALSLTSAQAR